MELTSVAQWLSSIHPTLAAYEQAFVEFGYEDTQMLTAAKLEDLTSDLTEMGVKKNHCRLILKALGEMSEVYSSTLPTLERKTLVSATRGSKSGVKIEIGVGKSRKVTPPKRLQTYKSDATNLLQADVANRLCEADIKRADFETSKVAFAATQNVKSDETRVRNQLKTVLKPAALKTSSKQKIQQAHDRKSEASKQKTAFCRKDSLKSAEVNQKHKLKQAIEPAVMKTKIDQKLAAAEQRKADQIQQKTAFSRSDSLKVEQSAAKKAIHEVIAPAVHGTALAARATTAAERGKDAQVAKVAFARSNSIKTEKALAKASDSSAQEKLGQENDQKMFNAANRKDNETAKKIAFAKNDSERVKAKGGTWIHVDDSDTPDPTATAAPASPICQLGASMSWGSASVK